MFTVTESYSGGFGCVNNYTVYEGDDLQEAIKSLNDINFSFDNGVAYFDGPDGEINRRYASDDD